MFSFLSLIFKSINALFCTMVIFHSNFNFYLHCNRITTLTPRDYIASKYLIARYINFIFQTKYGFNQFQKSISFNGILKIVLGSIFSYLIEKPAQVLSTCLLCRFGFQTIWAETITHPGPSQNY